MATRKFNPGFLSDDELVESFCVRTSEFESIIETLRENTGNSNQHVIVIGPRGSGKTSLLLRVAIETRRNPDLSSRIFPVTFAEESYEVSTCGEFWLECLSRLADQAPQPDWASDLGRTYQDLREIQDDRMLADRCLSALLDFSDRAGKRLLLAVENLNMMFADMLDPDAGWRLRKTLQTEPRIILLGSATSRFQEIDRPERALYDLFRVISLKPLGEEECSALWQTVSGECPERGKVRSLQILTGGSPRLIAIVAPFSTGQPLHELMGDLLDLVDQHTEYFKSHLDALASQERRVYLALADLWMPATTREIADRARLGSSICSAQLKRLISRGVVSDEGGTPRRKQYYLQERMYNIYYLLRRGGVSRVVEPVILFMTALYSQPELVSRILGEAARSDESRRSLYRDTLTQLSALPEMIRYRDMLLDSVSSLARTPPRSGPGVIVEGVPSVALTDSSSLAESDASKDTHLVVTVRNMGTQFSLCMEREQYHEALAICDKMIAIAMASDTELPREVLAGALVNKGLVLCSLYRWGEAAAACDQVMARFEAIDAPEIIEIVGIALTSKGLALSQTGASEEALVLYDEVVNRFEAGGPPKQMDSVATALVNKGNTLCQLGRSEEALEVYDEVVNRCEASDRPKIAKIVAKALKNKGATLRGLGRSEEELKVYDDVVKRFGANDAPDIIELVVEALKNKSITLRELGRFEEELKAYDEVVRRFGASDIPEIVEIVAKALADSGVTLGELARFEEELNVYDEVLSRFGASDIPEIVEIVAAVLMNKGVALEQLCRFEDALEVYDEVVQRLESCDQVDVIGRVGEALVHKGIALDRMNLTIDALDSFDEVVRRYEVSSSPGSVDIVAKAMVLMGVLLRQLSRSTADPDALEALSKRLGDLGKCERCSSLILAFFTGVDGLPEPVIHALVVFSAPLRARRALELIEGSAAVDKLLPLVTALQQEVGLKPRVAREVEEVAQDIRRELAMLRTAVPQGAGGLADHDRGG